MAQVTLTVGNRRYDLACRDGEEPRLHLLASLVDAKATEAARALGDTNEGRNLLMAALLLADELSDIRSGARPTADEALAGAIDALAQRIEAVAGRLENDRHPA